jgi:hypothetical protein
VKKKLNSYGKGTNLRVTAEENAHNINKIEPSFYKDSSQKSLLINEENDS